ncbi:glycine N-acyltransferase [Salarias fasciatus]|uniref:Glycine N-acyltransferase-like protein n=1 Tax=Salarias fasciatus TaxID=181472 RepID=A0A672JIF6_SALFA|nr:glycine N-acyltransferase-like [Salarias fasciatus]
MTVELTGDQLMLAETELKTYLPHSQTVYGCLVLRNRVSADPMNVFVDRWPKFSVIICKPLYQQESDLFKDIVVFAVDKDSLKETIKKSSIIDWTRFFCLGTSFSHMETITSLASEKNVPNQRLSLCHMMTLEDATKLPDIDSTGISVSSLDESHVGLVCQTWKFGRNEGALRMIRNMVVNFPSCCVLDSDGTPVSWILTYTSCAIGMLYTQPEHRGKGYAKVVVTSLAKRNHALGYPVYCFIEEENALSYGLFQSMGFTEDPSYRATWFGFNDF